MGITKRFQVFVSSTYLDLKEERQKVLHCLLGMGCFPAGMEFFPADDRDSWSNITQVIDDSDYYLLIIGGRYGSVDSKGLSFTEKEFRYAAEKGIPVLAFLHSNPEEIPAKNFELDSDLRQRLFEFRASVESKHLCQYWKNGNDLCIEVAVSLSSTIRTSPAVGWTRGGIEPIARSSSFFVTRHTELTKAYT